MFFEIMLALIAVATKTGARLRSYAHTVADFDSAFDVFADTCCFAYDFMPDDDGVACWAPAAGECVQV
jgi:hypothetical protein